MRKRLNSQRLNGKYNYTISKLLHCDYEQTGNNETSIHMKKQGKITLMKYSFSTLGLSL